MEHSESDPSKFGSFSPFAGLSSEVLWHIFSFLDYTTLQTARLVCRNWYSALLDEQFIHREQLVLGCNDFDKEDKQSVMRERKKLRSLIKCQRGFYHLKIKGLKYFVWISREFWKNIGVQLQSLLIVKSEVPEDTLVNYLKLCPTLKCLTLENCQNDFWAIQQNHGPKVQVNLSGLEALKIVCDTSLEFKFQKILKNSPNSKSVDLTVNLDFVRNSTVASTLAYVLDYFQHNPQVTLDLYLEATIEPEENDSIIVEDNLVHLLLLPNVQLRKFYTYYFPHRFYKNLHPWLSDLQLPDGTELTDNMMESICCNFPNLQKLIVRECKAVLTSEANFRIPRTLSYLDFDLFELGVTETTLLTEFCSETNETLKEVRFGGGYLSPAITFFTAFAKTHPSVTCLYLDFCNLDNRGLQAVLEHQVLLQELSLNNTKITDAGLMGDLVGGSSRNENPTPYLYAISRLKADRRNGSEILVWIQLSKITSKAVECLVENNPTIEVLGVQKLGITDNFIYSTVEKLPHLKSLNVIDNTLISANARSFLDSKKIFYGGL